MNVSISKGNSKMGVIPSVSLPAGKTCGNVPCLKKCYARKLERLRPNVRDSYENNLTVFLSNPTQYFNEVETAIKMSRFFRWHVSGDIPNKRYFAEMVTLGERNPKCEMLCFTKRYSVVNEWLDAGHSIPPNLHIIFSAWDGLRMENPHGLPEAHVRYKNGSTTARANAKECSGNCTECALTDGGCWTLKDGEQIIFNEH